ncbi:MAG: hypothetical protein U9R03_03540, partial [Candidatus Aerophobetes bacterium]|nr:hypothetical protein [Candidatus Aerophobetes bacterium]
SLKYKNVQLKADNIRLNLESLDLWAEGKVDLQMSSRRVRGESLKYNLRTKKGEVQSPEGIEGPIFYKASQAYLSPRTIQLSRTSFTTCDLSPPHYKIKAREVKIILDDEVIARDAVFYIRKYPFFWTPILVRYLNKKNKIMLPSVGYSNFAGWYVKTGYYFYSSPRLEGAIHLDYREKKGWTEGIDTFYKIDGGEGEIKSYFIKEKDTGEERWRLKLMHHQGFSRSTSLKLNLNRVSDEYFLENYFPEEDEEIPPSFLSLDYKKTDYNINFLLEPEVNPFNYEKTIQRLPQISLGFPAQKIKGTGLYLGKGVEAVNFEKGEKGLIRGDSFLDLSYPFTVFKCLQIEPTTGYHLFWYKDREGYEGYRRMPYQELSTYFQFGGGDEEKFTYSLTPGLTYYHSTEDKDVNGLSFKPEELEDYEKKTEDIHPPDLIKLGIKNELYYKEKPFSSGNLSIGYDLTEEKRGFSSLEGRFHLTPPLPLLNYIDLYFLYDYYDEEYKEIANNLDLKGESWHLNIGVKKDLDEGVDESILQGEVNLGEKWRLSGYRCYDMVKNEVSKESYSIWRDLHCWAAQLFYQRKPETEYSIMFYIKAFPEYWLKFYPGVYPYFKE